MASRFASLEPDLLESDEDDYDVDMDAPIQSLNQHLRVHLPERMPISPLPTNDLPPPSSGPRPSSPIVGDRAEKAKKRREKALKRNRAQKEAEDQAKCAAEESQTEADLIDAHKYLKDKGLRFGQLLAFISNPDKKQGSIRWQEFFRYPGEATQILEWWTSSYNTNQARDEVTEWAIEHVANILASEARSVTSSKILQTMGKVVDQEFVEAFSYTTLHDQLQEAAPVGMRMLESFTTSRNAATKHTANRRARTKTVITSTALACLGEYSHANNISKRMMGMYLYSGGAQRQTLTVLSTLGISESYSNLVTKNKRRERKKKTESSKSAAQSHTDDVIPSAAEEPSTTPTVQVSSIALEQGSSNSTATTPPANGTSIMSNVDLPSHYTGTLRQLSVSMRWKARALASLGLYATVYDNINMMFRNAEQIIGRHDSQENGTCATLFPLFNANRDDLKTENYQTHFLESGPLKLEDLLHTSDERKSFKNHLIFTILRIIIKNGGEGFEKFEKDLEKEQPITKDKIDLHKTDIYPLPTWNINESSITGNIEVDAAIVKELHLDKDPEFWKLLRFHGGDQLSLARFRSIENIRAGQEPGYNGFFGSTWIPGLFHGKMADTTGTLFTHWGKPNTGTRNPGSLWFHNTRLDRLPITFTSLPSFRVCRDLIFVSLYARVLHCLMLVANVSSPAEYLTRYGSWKLLRSHASKIYEQYVETSVVARLRHDRARAHRSKPSNSERSDEGDMVFENAVLFMRDALISREFSDAVKSGDSGRIVLVLKAWALNFRGNGRTKYAYEMLHLIHNLTTVWSDKVRKIVMNNWLVNPTGQPNSWVEIDLMQEHLNYWIKVFYKAHGANATWEWLEWISPTVDILRKLSKSFNDILGADQGTRHAPANLSDDISSLMESLDEHNVYRVQKGRTLDEDELVKDVATAGLESLISGTKNPISEYNAAFKRLQTRRRMNPIIPGSHTLSTASPGAAPAPHPMSPQGSHPLTNPSTPVAEPVVLDDLADLDDTMNPEAERDDNGTDFLDELGQGEADIMLSVLTAADVDLDMDERVLEEEILEEMSDVSDEEWE